ncbi:MULTISPECIES: hypothetical protein [Methylomonas]|uniref:hypothetical protein n=1 Tax=Methylomonas TaxID=416 RepID=UPI001231FC0C|nr:hypothetical protein [Methylomonas rhizoryzae]
MTGLDSYLHLIGAELLIILGAVIPLLDDKTHKRALTLVFSAVLGFMLAHFISHVLPNRLADFIYSSHRDYRSLKNPGKEPT